MYTIVSTIDLAYGHINLAYNMNIYLGLNSGHPELR